MLAFNSGFSESLNAVAKNESGRPVPAVQPHQGS